MSETTEKHLFDVFNAQASYFSAHIATINDRSDKNGQKEKDFNLARVELTKSDILATDYLKRIGFIT